MRVLPLVVVLAIVFGARPGAAQEATSPTGAFDLEPHVGVLLDGYDAGATGSRRGVLGELAVGYGLAPGLRARGTLGLARSSDVSAPGDPENYHVYGNRYIGLSTGAEYRILPGRTSVSIGLELGAVWREIVHEDTVGEPTGVPEYAGDGYTPYFLALPSLAVRRQVSDRLSLGIRLADYLMEMEEHSPSLTLGLVFR